MARLYFPSDPRRTLADGPRWLGPTAAGAATISNKSPSQRGRTGASGELRLRVRQRRHMERPDVAYSGRMLSRSQRAAPRWRNALAQDRA